MYNINLEEVDTDGAIREGAEEVSSDTRLDFLRKATVAGGSVVAGGAMLGALAPMASARINGDPPPVKPFGKGDIGILNFALVLEYLESSFYNEATKNQQKNAFITNPQTRLFLSAVTNDENQHVAAIKATIQKLGHKPIGKPTFNFRGDTNNEKKFVDASFAFENEGVHAYSGQAFNIASPAVLKAALSIVTIEARHASVIGLIRNRSEFGITPDGAFDKPRGFKRVYKDVSDLKYITKL